MDWSMAESGEPQRWFFVHMQKTAGTALFNRLKHQFGERAVYPMSGEGPRVDLSLNTDFLVERFAARRDEIRVVTGHFPLCVTELLGVPFSTFTVLREPVERTLSFLRHHKQRASSSRELTLEQIYDDYVLNAGLIQNHMVKMLSLTREEMTRWAMTVVTFDDARLQRAAHNLEHRIDIFGLQEHFDGFCADISARWGWDLGTPPRANTTEPVDVDDDFRDRIARDNAMDVALYRFAEELWRRRHAAHQTSGT
jgi:hypothetical protein